MSWETANYITIVLCWAAIAVNVWASINYRRSLRNLHRINHTIQLIGEAPDGDTYLLATYQMTSEGMNDPLEITWKNETALPVRLAAVSVHWHWPALDASGSNQKRADTDLDPQDSIKIVTYVQNRPVTYQEESE